MSFIRYQIDLIRAPGETIRRLAETHDSALIGFKNVFLTACLYDIAIGLWLIGDATVTAPAFLRIPDELYYTYEVFFLIPVFISAWLLAAGIIYLLSRFWGGTGSFDALLGGLGASVAVCAYFTLIPDLIQGVLFSTRLMSQDQYLTQTGRGILPVIVWAYLIGYLVSNTGLFAAATHHTQNLPRLKSAIIGLTGFVGYFGLLFTFIR